MQKITGDEGSMWGTSIISFGKAKYTLSNGKENEWMEWDFHLENKTGKSCLYLKKLEGIDMKILE